MRFFKSKIWLYILIFLRTYGKNIMKMILSYTIPIIHIIMVSGRIEEFTDHMAIFGVMLGANAAFLVAISFDFFRYKYISIGLISFFMLLISGVLPFIVINMEQSLLTPTMSLKWYSNLLLIGTVSAFLLSLLISFVETHHEHIRFAKEAQTKTSFNLNGNNIDI